MAKTNVIQIPIHFIKVTNKTTFMTSFIYVYHFLLNVKFFLLHQFSDKIKDDNPIISITNGVKCH